MKAHFINHILSALILVVAVISFSACGGHGGDEDNVTQKRLTSGTWNVSRVTVDGIDKTSLFTGMKLTFTTTGYTATNGEPVWPASGTWTFGDAEKKMVKRDDGVEVSIQSLDDNSLTLSLNWNKTTLGSGRNTSVGGVHVFELVK
jgi:hypothetical protein